MQTDILCASEGEEKSSYLLIVVVVVIQLVADKWGLPCPILCRVLSFRVMSEWPPNVTDCHRDSHHRQGEGGRDLTIVITLSNRLDDPHNEMPLLNNEKMHLK